mmetsp:Transcript_8478/g.12643  ORF Transcript_8478/g.12643 Transcript_8478/m.12643 type:complete len:230 (+) Transcript_8478:79-768(+)
MNFFCGSNYSTSIKSVSSRSGRPKVLCLHGFRTSGLILERQMAAMRCHVDADFVYMDGPFEATGPPDSGVRIFYPNLPYYEWYSLSYSQEAISRSMELILKELRENGPYDGILGFSQGACMATRVAYRLQSCPEEFKGLSLKYVILIGGVPPNESEKSVPFSPITLPNLHIMGDEDYVLDRSVILQNNWYDSKNSELLKHSGGHHIPPLRSGLYPAINTFIRKHKEGCC